MIHDYIIYRSDHTWRYLDRYGGKSNHRVIHSIQFTAEISFSLFLSLHRQQPLRTHVRNSWLYSLHEFYCILHGITIARHSTMQSRPQTSLVGHTRLLHDSQDTRYFNVDWNFLIGTKDATKNNDSITISVVQLATGARLPHN